MVLNKKRLSSKKRYNSKKRSNMCGGGWTKIENLLIDLINIEKEMNVSSVQLKGLIQIDEKLLLQKEKLYQEYIELEMVTDDFMDRINGLKNSIKQYQDKLPIILELEMNHNIILDAIITEWEKNNYGHTGRLKSIIKKRPYKFTIGKMDNYNSTQIQKIMEVQKAEQVRKVVQTESESKTVYVVHNQSCKILGVFTDSSKARIFREETDDPEVSITESTLTL